MKKEIIAGLLGCVLAGVAIANEQSVSIEQIAAAIEKHIAAKAKANGGYLRLPHAGKELKLKLVRVHMEYLADLGGGVQFACVDLIGADGPVYDVDFFLKGGPNDMTVTETTVHKVNGQPLYTWEQREDGTWRRVLVTDASPRLLGVVQGTDEFEFIYKVLLPEISGEAKLWLPLVRSDAYQTVEVKKIIAPSQGRQIEEPKYGNKILFFTAGPEDRGKTVEIQYRVLRREKSPYPTARSTTQKDLAPERLVPANDMFNNIAKRVTAGKATDLIRARALYEHVIEELRYARYGSGWGRGDAVYACSAKSGNCSDFHSYFVALARAVNIPARFIVGASIPSERNEGGIDGYHCWAEFFADGQWWPVDISEANKNPSLKTYYFGHQPANRIELSQGRDLVLEPAPTSGPINFHAYAVLEVDGQPSEAKTEFLFQRNGPAVLQIATLPKERGGQELVGTRLPKLDFEPRSSSPHGSIETKATLYRWWTDTCPFCEKSLPALEALRMKYEEAGLEVVAVYHPKPPRWVSDQAIRKFAERLGYQGEIAQDLDWSKWRKAYAVADPGATSVSLLVDAKGVIRFVHPGPEFHPSADPQHQQCNSDYELLERAVRALVEADK